MAHTVISPPRGTTATLELTHKGNINDKTIPERDREVRDFNVTLLASAITRRRHLVIDTHRTDRGVTRQGCHHIHEMIVTANRTCVLLASEDMITQRIAHTQHEMNESSMKMNEDSHNHIQYGRIMLCFV